MLSSNKPLNNLVQRLNFSQETLEAMTKSTCLHHHQQKQCG